MKGFVVGVCIASLILLHGSTRVRLQQHDSLLLQIEKRLDKIVMMKDGK